MLKIVVVDDEKYIRKGIIKMMDDAGTGFQVVGEAGDGLTALTVIESTYPDVVITDIKMPKLDGVELIKKLNLQFPDMREIVLSGFDDYSYVRDSMKYGAMDYLLKPIDEGQLIGLLKKTDAELIMEREKRDTQLHIQSQINENFSFLKECFIREMICQGFSSQYQLLQKLQYFHLRLESDSYFVLIVSMDNSRYLMEKLGNDEIKDRLLKLKLIVEQSVQKYIEFAVCANEHDLILLGLLSWEHSELPETVAAEINGNLQEKVEFKFTVGLGTRVTTFSELKESYQQAMTALKWRFYHENSEIVRLVDAKRPVKMDLSDLVKTFEINLGNCLEVAHAQPVPMIIREFCLKIKEWRVDSEEVVLALEEIFNKMQFNYKLFKETTQELYGPGFSYSKTINLFDTLNAIEEYTSQLYTAVFTQIGLNIRKKEKRLIEVVKDYILQHYHEDVTLNKVAEIAYVTPNYVCELFKKHTGESFIDFLTKVRVEKAKELLKDIKVKAYEVGSMVGYDDPAYFSRVFKKVVGISPNEYRNVQKL